MSKPPRDRVTSRSNTYFITATANGNRALFQSERVANLLIETLLLYRDQREFFLHEFVVMPNHIHLLLTTGHETTLERGVQLIKGGFSFRANKELGIASEIWQRGYVDIVCVMRTITHSTVPIFTPIPSEPDSRKSHHNSDILRLAPNTV